MQSLSVAMTGKTKVRQREEKYKSLARLHLRQREEKDKSLARLYVRTRKNFTRVVMLPQSSLVNSIPFILQKIDSLVVLFC